MDTSLKRKLWSFIDAISENCRQRNKFFDYFQSNDLETSMHYTGYSEEKKQMIREKYNSILSGS